MKEAEYIVMQLQGMFDGFKQEIRDEMNTFKQEIKQEIEQEMEQKFEEIDKKLTDKFFLFENDYGTKINFMYDLMVIAKEKSNEAVGEVNKLESRIDRCEVQVCNLDIRISNLEKNA